MVATARLHEGSTTYNVPGCPDPIKAEDLTDEQAETTARELTAAYADFYDGISNQRSFKAPVQFDVPGCPDPIKAKDLTDDQIKTLAGERAMAYVRA
jgi:hypothetical protein